MSRKLCECGCGNLAPVATHNNTARKHVKGQQQRFCLGHGSTKHGCAFTPEYRAYTEAKTRCTNSAIKYWANYGGRGIKFLFTSFEQFFAEIGLRPSPKHSLDRINNDGNYEPGNVKWSTHKEQESNKRKKVWIPKITLERVRSWALL